MVRIGALLVMLLVATSAWAAEYLKDASRPDSWALEVTGPARATLQADGGAIRVDVAATSSEAWHVQLVQNDRPLQQGKRYVLSFAAKASSSRTIHTYAQIGMPPWDHIWPAKALDLTTNYQNFTFDVSLDRNTDGKGRLPVFAMGNLVGSIWIKDASLRDASDPAPAGAESVVIVIPADAGPTTDLMTNANDPASWTLEPHENVSADIRSEDSGLRVDVTRNSAERWHLQLFQGGKSLSPGKAYVLKFQAKASAPRKVSLITVQQANDPWHLCAGMTDVDFGTSWKQYTLKFRVNADATGVMRSPLFQLGDATGTVWLRNVTLTDAPAK